MSDLIGLILGIIGLALVCYGFIIGPFTIFVPLGFLIAGPMVLYDFFKDSEDK